MFCKKCGKEIKEEDKFCPYCGQDVSKPVEEEIKKEVKKSESAVGWGFLGFFIPIAGLILFIIWNSDLENKAKGKAAGVGALISVCVSVGCTILYYIILIILSLFATSNIPDFTTILSNILGLF